MSIEFRTCARTFGIAGEPCGAGKPLLIAEIGTGHGGDPGRARELVEAAAEAGAGCVKFQLVYADEILHPNTGTVPLPGGPVRLYDRFRELEVPLDFYAELKDRVEAKGLLFLCTPFGPRSARELRDLGVGAFKVASPELNYDLLVRQVASYGKPTFVSSGVSRLADVEAALEPFGAGQACLLHCVTAYPAPASDYNLRLLPGLSDVLGVPVGVSDHSEDPELVPVLAAALGACAVEKHFCLSRDGDGLDDPIALTPELFARMADSVAAAAEAGPAAAVEALASERGRAAVEAVLGDGVKRLAPSEAANYERTNRSLHAVREIAAGETLGDGDVAVLRTEKVLRPGLPPSWAAAVVGRKARERIPAGEGIRFEDV